MSQVVLFFAVVAFVYAAPPIVPDPAKTVPANPVPAMAVAVKPEAAQPEPVRAKPIKPELLKFEPIRLEPVEPEPVLAEHEEVEKASGPCEDGVNNVIEVADVGGLSAAHEKPTNYIFNKFLPDSLRIHTQGVVAHTYDDNGSPSCYKGRARLSLPGIIKLVKGERKMAISPSVLIRSSV